MPFTIPNAADAFNANQAEPDKVDIDILVAALQEDGVVFGCAVTAQGVPDMTVAVAAGSVQVGLRQGPVAAGNVTITAADGTNPRFTLIVADSAGVKSAVNGTAAAEPVFPAIPAESVVLAAVYVPAGDTAIQSNQITDKRCVVHPRGWNPRRTWFIGQDFSGGGDRNSLVFSSLFGGGGTPGLISVEDEMGVMDILTGAVSGDGVLMALGGAADAAGIDFDVDTELFFRARVLQSAARRYFVGLTTTLGNGLPPVATIEQAGFVLDSANPTNFRVRHGDTAAVTEVDYVPAVAADLVMHTFSMRRTATSIFFRIDNNAEMERTTTLPSLTVGLLLAVGVITTGAVAKEAMWSYIFGWRTGMSR